MITLLAGPLAATWSLSVQWLAQLWAQLWPPPRCPALADSALCQPAWLLEVFPLHTDCILGARLAAALRRRLHDYCMLGAALQGSRLALICVPLASVSAGMDSLRPALITLAEAQGVIFCILYLHSLASVLCICMTRSWPRLQAGSAALLV